MAAQVVERDLRREADMPYHFTRAQYEQMVEAGILTPSDRCELLGGEIVGKMPQRSAHATSISLANEVLRNTYGAGYHVRTQLPLALGPVSEPEPDIAVVEGPPRAYRDAHPEAALLVVEVADTSLEKNRGPKAAIYARAGIEEYWIVNLKDECLEVYRIPDGSGETYQEKTTKHRGDGVKAPKTSGAVSVADLLP